MKVIQGRATEAGSELRSATFTGEVWADPILAPTEGVTINSVFFAPEARTDWHTHEGGQILIVTSGEGKVRAEGDEERRIRCGDTVWISPGERHWHGAGESTYMVHLAISLGAHDWQEAVTVAEFRGERGDGDATA
jgi:quercetin dioxygenase-like cupin family protein